MANKFEELLRKSSINPFQSTSKSEPQSTYSPTSTTTLSKTTSHPGALLVEKKVAYTPEVIEAKTGKVVEESKPIVTQQYTTKVMRHYETTVTAPEQVQEIKQQAETSGGKAYVKEVIIPQHKPTEYFRGMSIDPTTYIKSGGDKPKIVVGIDIPSKNVDFTPQITITPEHEIEKRKIVEMSQKQASEKYEKATLPEKVGLHVRTLLSEKSHEYVGSHFPFSEKKPEDVVKEKLALDIQSPETKPEKAALKGMFIEFPQSIVFEAETSALVGAGVAKVGATQIGSKILSSAPAKVGLGILGVTYIGKKSESIATAIKEGRIAEATGQAVGIGTSIAAAGIGYKLEKSHIMEQMRNVEMDISYVRGGSISASKKDITISAGEFRARTPKLEYDIRGDVVSVSTKKGDFFSIAKIPKQKVGGLEIEPKTESFFGKTVSVGKGKYVSAQSNMLLRLSESEARLVGSKKGISFFAETGKTQAGKFDIKFFKGVSELKTAEEYQLKGAYDPLINKFALLEKSGKVRTSYQYTDWFDITPKNIKPTTTSFKPSTTTITKTTHITTDVVPKIDKITISGKTSALIKEGLLPEPQLRIVPISGIKPLEKTEKIGKHELSFKELSIEKQKQESIIATSIKIKPLEKLQKDILPSPKITPFITSIPKPSQDTSSIITTITDSIVTEKPETITKELLPPPTVSIPSPPPIIALPPPPSLSLGGGDLFSRKKSLMITKQPKKYTPSLSGLFVKPIKKEPKRTLSGIGIRPIVR